MIHADASSNLLDPASWSITPGLGFDPQWLPEGFGTPQDPGYLEGNAVAGPDGTIFNILRFNSRPVLGNWAVKLRLNSTTNQLEFDKLLELPGGHTKFVIRRDNETGLYYTLSNVNDNLQYTDQRNILVLCVSVDLDTWTTVLTLLVDDTGLSPRDSSRYTGFHYVDWHFDKDDIIAVIRTSYRGADSYHNSNRLTFKTIANFRSHTTRGLMKLEVGPPGAVIQSPQGFFETSLQDYNVTVPMHASTIDITVTLLLPHETATVGGQAAVSGQPVHVPFSKSDTSMSVPVTISAAQYTEAAQYTRAYTLFCSRAKAPLWFSDTAGFREATLDDGTLAFFNRGYVFKGVPPELKGHKFTRINGDAGKLGTVAVAATVHVDVAGTVLRALVAGNSSECTVAKVHLAQQGWTLTNESSLYYNDSKRTHMQVFVKTFGAGSSFSLDQAGAGWAGLMLVWPPPFGSPNNDEAPTLAKFRLKSDDSNEAMQAQIGQLQEVTR